MFMHLKRIVHQCPDNTDYHLMILTRLIIGGTSFRDHSIRVLPFWSWGLGNGRMGPEMEEGVTV